MTKKFHFKHIITVLILALSLAVALPTTMSVDAAGAKLNKTKVTVCTGKSYTLKMSGVSKKVSWTTSDKKVAIIKTSGKNKATCKLTAKKNGTATVTAKVKVGKKTKTFKCKVTVKAHTYGKSNYQWSADNSSCTASKKCTRCGNTLKQTVKASRTDTPATCTNDGNATYTAKFSKYGFATQTKKVNEKAKGHTYNAPIYTWASDGSSCTASVTCTNCKEGFSETTNATATVLVPATKDSQGVKKCSVSFANKQFVAQTKEFAIPMLAYLEKEAIIIDYNKPMDVRVCNDTIDTIRFFDASGNEVDGYNNALFYKIYGTISEDKTSVNFSTGYKTEENTLVAKITTTRGQVLSCSVSTKFVPGEYKFGKIYVVPTGGYRGYGKLKGTYGDGAYDYIVDCNTKAEYDVAYDYFHNQTLTHEGGKGNLNAKCSEIESACSERSLYKSDYNKSMQNKAVAAGYSKVFYTNYIDEQCSQATKDYFYLFTTTDGSFAQNINSQSQVDAIVTAWANENNNGVLPSWYYPTVFSDWAEWSGRDLGLN